MNKSIYILLFITQFIFAQIDITDIGAIQNKDRTVFKNDVSNYIQQIIDSGLTAIIPDGNFYVSNPIYINKDNVVIVGKSPSNIGANLYTNKPIDIFRIERVENTTIKGISIYYIGKDIVGTECSAIRLGGFKKIRYGLIRGDFDFDFYGDKNHFISNSVWKKPHYREDYIYWENPNYDFALSEPYDNVDNYNSVYTGYGAHAFWVDYVNENSLNYSYLHFTKIRGDWKHANTGFKSRKRDYKKAFQSTNTLDLDVLMIGCKTYFFIDGISFSKIRVLGNESSVLDWDEKHEFTKDELLTPYYYFNGNKSNVDVFLYDRHQSKGQRYAGKHKKGGYIDGKLNNINGFSTNIGIGLLSDTENGYKPFIDAKIVSSIMVGPTTVDTYNNQNIYGNKEIKDTLTIDRKGVINIEKYGSLKFNGKKVAPRRCTDPKTLNELIELLKNTGIIYD